MDLCDLPMSIALRMFRIKASLEPTSQDTVTRACQLESIREFLTNASLSVLIHSVFTIAFLVATWIYSTTLFWIVAATIPAYVVISLLVTGPFVQDETIMSYALVHASGASYLNAGSRYDRGTAGGRSFAAGL